MNIERKYIDLASAFFVGVAAGALTVKVLVEKKLREEFAFQMESVENTYEAAIALRDARDFVAETEREREKHVELNEGRVTDGQEPIPFVDRQIEDVEAPNYLGEVVVTPPEQEPTQNQYHQALSATETPVEQFVDGGVNDYGVSYIEDEDYLDEDGRFKGKIDILIDNGNPIFLMDGVQIDDWEKRVGDSILVDMFRLCPPGTDPVLYVRNHRTDEDYEVVRAEP